MDKETPIKLDSIKEAIDDIRAGKVVIVVDDEDRENEGDFIVAASKTTPEVINFMSKHGRGLICVGLLEDRCDALGLELMVNNNTALHETAFTVSIDLLGHGCTTGISAKDRSKTVLSLINPATKPSDLGRPGQGDLGAAVAGGGVVGVLRVLGLRRSRREIDEDLCGARWSRRVSAR